jgi:hypothetical protein
VHIALGVVCHAPRTRTRFLDTRCGFKGFIIRIDG